MQIEGESGFVRRAMTASLTFFLSLFGLACLMPAAQSETTNHPDTLPPLLLFFAGNGNTTAVHLVLNLDNFSLTPNRNLSIGRKEH